MESTARCNSNQGRYPPVSAVGGVHQANASLAHNSRSTNSWVLLAAAFVVITNCLLNVEQSWSLALKDVAYMKSARTTEKMTANDILSLIQQQEEQEKRTTKRAKTAVVWTTLAVDDCGAGRLRHLMETVGPNRDVWVLATHLALPTQDERVARSIHHVQELQRDHANFLGMLEQSRASYFPFDTTTSGSAKSSFLRFVRDAGYEQAWMVEDDVFYTGSWKDLFDRNDGTTESDENDVPLATADVVSMRHIGRDKAGWFERKGACWVDPGGRNASSHVDTRQACVDVRLEASFWFFLRVSRRLALALLSALEHGLATGHHEAILASFCQISDYSMATLQADGHLVAGSWGNWKNASQQGLWRHNPISPGALYHPVKCAAHASDRTSLQEAALGNFKTHNVAPLPVTNDNSAEPSLKTTNEKERKSENKQRQKQQKDNDK